MTTSPDQPAFSVVDNSANDRFELYRRDELVGFARYSTHDDTVVVTHVETVARYRDQGFAARLMAGILEQLRADGRTIVPRCSYARTYVRDHPEHHDLVGRR